MNKLCCYINVQFKLISHPYKIKQWLHAHMAALALPLVYNIPWRQAVHVLELCLFPFFYHNLLTVTLRNEWVHVWYRWTDNSPCIPEGVSSLQAKRMWYKPNRWQVWARALCIQKRLLLTWCGFGSKLGFYSVLQWREIKEVDKDRDLLGKSIQTQKM